MSNNASSSSAEAAPPPDALLADWRDRAARLESEIGNAVVGQSRAIRLAVVAVFARGHVLLEGDVGVGKTTLLRSLARGIGGAYERVEGTIDLMPSDLIYYTYINEEGKPRVDPGPLLKHEAELSTFFFNEVNRARPQVHSLLLRVMAERSASAFNRIYRFPHLQVFADRNRVEKEETFEIPSAARDRFLMEIGIEAPTDATVRRQLTFDPRFHDTDELIESVAADVLPYQELNTVAATIQRSVHATETLEQYVLDLCSATARPVEFGVALSDVDMSRLVLAGMSPRGMSMLLRAARVMAWLNQRDILVPEDVHAVFPEVAAHRVFFTPVYELRRSEVAGRYVHAILEHIAAP